MYDNNIYKVGESYEALKTMENCAIMLWNNYLGFKIIYRTPYPTAEDKLFFDTGRPFEFRWWEHGDGVIFFAFKFGGIKMWCDSVFSASPKLYEKNVPTFPDKFDKDDGYRVSIIGIDSRLGEVFGIREIALPNGFSRYLNAACCRTKSRALSAEDFNKVVDRVFEPQEGVSHDGSYIANLAWEYEALKYASYNRTLKKHSQLIERHPVLLKNIKKKSENYYVFSTEASDLISFSTAAEEEAARARLSRELHYEDKN